MMFLEAVAGNAMLLTALHGIALQKFYDARMLLRTFRLDRHNPKSEAMQKRGRAAEEFSRGVIELVSIRSAELSQTVTPAPKPAAKRVARGAGPDSMFTAAPLRFRDLRHLPVATSPAQPLPRSPRRCHRRRRPRLLTLSPP